MDVDEKLVKHEKVCIDEKLVKHIALLAKLNLTDKEIGEFIPQLKEILDYFDTIKKADTKNTKPSIQPIELKNALREDISKKSLPQELILSLTEHKKQGYFKGPRVV